MVKCYVKHAAMFILSGDPVSFHKLTNARSLCGWEASNDIAGSSIGDSGDGPFLSGSVLNKFPNMVLEVTVLVQALSVR